MTLNFSSDPGVIACGPIPTKPPYQLRAEKLFRRRITTAYDASERKAWRAAEPCVRETTGEDWAALEKFYAAPQSQTYARKDYATLLNHWNGEVQRAHAWVKAQNQPVAMMERSWKGGAL